MSRAKTILEQTGFSEKHASFETVALFPYDVGERKSAAISKQFLSYIFLAVESFHFYRNKKRN